MERLNFLAQFRVEAENKATEEERRGKAHDPVREVLKLSEIFIGKTSLS